MHRPGWMGGMKWKWIVGMESNAFATAVPQKNDG
jgi:hypothetical protein